MFFTSFGCFGNCKHFLNSLSFKTRPSTEDCYVIGLDLRLGLLTKDN